MTNIPTPRTHARAFDLPNIGKWVDVAFARQLERELAVALARALKAEIKAECLRIALLDLANPAGGGISENRSEAALDAIRKADIEGT